MERNIGRLNWKEIKNLVPERINTCILPVGTMEAHGVTATGTDIIIPRYLSDKIAEKFDFLTAPEIPYGITHSLLPYPGSITVDDRTFEQYVHGVLIGLKKTGFKRVIIMNGHGGNNQVLDDLAFRIYRETGLFCAVIHWWILCSELTKEFFGETGAHAGVDENGMILAIAPELVKEELLEEDDIYLYSSGLRAVPIPGSVITYKKGEGKPRFNREEAVKFSEKVVDCIAEHIIRVLKGWNKLDGL